MPNQDDARKAARSAGKRGPLSRATLLILKFAVGFWIVLVNFDEAAKAAVINSGKAGGSDHAIVVSVIHEAEQSPLRSAQFDRIDVSSESVRLRLTNVIMFSCPAGSGGTFG